jgi:glutamine phosphoribosylpyrophosphate amidotransferase
MCGIFCSFDSKKAKELLTLNSYRGSHSYSFTVVGDEPIRGLGEFDVSLLDKDGYKICHVQAPTTEARGYDSIHPAEFDGMRLWHNGIVKDFDVKRLQQKYGVDTSWDTMLILYELSSANWEENLSEINGSFACILQENGMVYAFRNEISPLFYDNEMNISSVIFNDSRPLPPNRMFVLDLGRRKIEDIGCSFKTKENPYYFGDE